MYRAGCHLLVLLGLNGISSPPRGRAQPATYDHSAVIERVLKDIGGIDNLSRATPNQRALLAFHYSERGQFFLDLYEYERLIVRDHALHRDSVGKHGGPAIPAAHYFLGRAQQELGLVRDAAASYAAASASSPEPIRALATAWNATLSANGGKSWMRDLTAWREGRAVAPAPCPPATRPCELFEAVLADNVPALARLQHDMLTSVPPDYHETVKAGADSYPVDFYDPIVTSLLAAADYTLAAHVLNGVKASPEIETINGIALWRSGRTRNAESVLRQVVSAGAAAGPRGAVALGELLYRNGDVAEAETFWRASSDQAANMVLDARGRVGGDAATGVVQGALRQYQIAKSKRWAGMRDGSAGGEYLARALIRADQPREALDVLDAVRPPSVGNDLNKIRPDVLVLSSRAHYALGRRDGLPENYPFSRGDLGDLAADFPSVIPTLTLLQILIAPPNHGIVR